LTLVVEAKDYAATARWLRDDPALRFEELIDLCGVTTRSFGEVSSGFVETQMGRTPLRGRVAPLSLEQQTGGCV